MVPRRLAPQLILDLTVLVAIIEGAFGLLYARRQERQVLDSMILGQDQLSRAIVSATWHAMLADQRDTAYEAMQTIATREGIDRIRIFNKEGRVMFATGQDVGAMVDKRAEACFVCHAEAQPLVRVMAEAPTQDECDGVCARIVDVVRDEQFCNYCRNDCRGQHVYLNYLGK